MNDVHISMLDLFLLLRIPCRLFVVAGAQGDHVS
jgi:hypothetical protein